MLGIGWMMTWMVDIEEDIKYMCATLKGPYFLFGLVNVFFQYSISPHAFSFEFSMLLLLMKCLFEEAWYLYYAFKGKALDLCFHIMACIFKRFKTFMNKNLKEQYVFI